MEVKDQRVLVVGLGKSGVSAGYFLHGLGARVTVSDSKAEAQLGKDIPRLLDLGIAVETGGHGERTFRDQDWIVVSPGVSLDTPQLVQARARGVPIVGELELAAQHLKGKIVAITGANGKTTTTSLVGEILAKSGRATQVGGNIGTPVTDLIAASTDSTWNVLEVSSFQLETIQTFRPHIAAILNITPDHLDRHKTFEAYAAAKARIFENQTDADFAVLNLDDPACRDIGARVRSRLHWFVRKDRTDRGCYARAGSIFFRGTDAVEIEVLPISEIPLKGAHNLENVLAAVCMTMLAGCKPEDIRRAVREFKAVEHRLQHVSDVAGVAYYNDSKATNVDATIKALESFPSGIHLILGGKDKGSDYTVLIPLIQKRVKRVYTIGAAAEKIESHLAGCDVVRAGTLENALQMASAAAVKGDVVLLAPACASFDQFENYEHRGRVFKELVAKLAAESPAPAGGRHG